MMLPVEEPPIFRVCLAVVSMVAGVLKVKFPEEEASPVSPKTWNLAEEVAVPPMTKSLEISDGEMTPELSCQMFKPEELTQLGMPPETVST